jgi:hypothetical protein
MTPRQGEDTSWIVAAARRWNLDRVDPRSRLKRTGPGADTCLVTTTNER